MFVCLFLQLKVNQIYGVMTENIEKVLNRGEGMDDLTERSQLLRNTSSQFHRKATRHHHGVCFKSVKLWVCCLLIVLVILGIVVGIIAAIVALAATGKFK